MIYHVNSNIFFDLSYLGIINIIGDNARNFLQGQLTCDMNLVDKNQVQYGAMCDIKGRVIALINAIEWNGLRLVLPFELIEKVKSILNKTAVLSRVKLETSNDINIIGFKQQNLLEQTPFDVKLELVKHCMVQNEEYACYHVHDDLYIFLVSQSAMHKLHGFSRQQWKGASEWRLLQLEAKRVEIYAASSGMFLPHRIGLQHTGYLNFNKGCYKGQEIIARMHYRGVIKHELQIIKMLLLESELEKLTLGSNLAETTSNQQNGELIDFCIIDDNNILAAVSVKNDLIK